MYACTRMGMQVSSQASGALLLGPACLTSLCCPWQIKIDRDSRCVEWSILDKCSADRKRMAQLCNTSCTIHERCARSTFSGWSVGVCDKALRCEVKDKRADCAHRAKLGECTSKPTRMAIDCLSTCAAHDVDGVLSAQRPEMRAKLSKLYDVPVPMSRAQERCWIPGWSGHNQYKLHLPTQCAAARTLPWHRYGPRRVPALRLHGSTADALTCPLDVRQTTPRVVWEGAANVTLLPHTPHTVHVVQVLASPRVRLLRHFITAEEAEEILRLAGPLFHRSPVRSVATDRRTSSTATLGGGLFGKAANWAVQRIRERIAAFSGYDETQLEPLQVVRYHPGEKYEAHHDLFDLCDFPQKPRRHLTFLIYLNDLPEGSVGGETTFPRMHLAVRPEKHMALVFNDVLDNGMDDERSEHSGTAPSQGVKYAINWYGPPACERCLRPLAC